MPEFIHPLDDHILTRDFDYKASLYVGGQHAAADYIRETGMTRGAAIISIAAGSVVRTNWDYYSGFMASVDHGDGWMSTYRHLLGPSPLRTGQPVTQGQLVGYVGNTGASLGDHLHFDLWNHEKHDPTAFFKNGWWAHDPELYLGKEVREEDDDDMTIIISPSDGPVSKRGKYVLVDGVWKKPLSYEASLAIMEAGQWREVKMPWVQIEKIPSCPF